MKFHSSAVLVALSSALLGGSSAFLPPSLSTQRNAFGVNTFTSKPLRMSTEAATEAETFEFTSDVGRVMDLIINSLYSDKDIFLRELISNAADACDKKRFLSITDNDVASAATPEIKIKANLDDNILIIEDAGVGMTKEELKNNLGKIAQSGTKAFVEALGQGNADVNLIGQFGVGFYSSYLVAEKVEVITKSMQEGSKQYKWSSTADSSYTIEEDSESDDPIDGSGTRLILHLKEDANEYLESSKIEELLERYSEFIEFPISVWKETTEYKQVPDEEANKDLPEGEEPKMKTVPETKEGYERVNNQKPIWLRSPKEVTEEEYKDFYTSAFKASYDEPMKHTHFVLEGQVECKAILYIPGMLPFELSKDMFDENSRNIRLYVKRVFINDAFEDLMPRWLKFVKGVVDSDDLPLNVSREILQKSKVLSIINKRLVRKSVDMIRDIAEEDAAQYIMFWNNFGKYLKVGVVEDDRNRKELAPLLRFWSSKSGEEYTSLDDYVENMAEGQKQIYYVTGDGKELAAMSPVVEKLASRGYDVLLATEPLDEIMFESLRSYKELDIVDAAKENLKLDGEDDEETKKKKEQLEEEFKVVKEYLEGILKGKVQKVVISDLLTDSPAALVQGAYGMSPSMQRYMKAQAVASGQDAAGMGNFNQAVLEINPTHPIVQDLDRMVKEDKESKDLENSALLMYDVASMTSGYNVGDVKGFAQRVMSLMNDQVKAQNEDASTPKDAEVIPEIVPEVVSEDKDE
ncbi:shock protein HSP 90 [Seminavis robusta]|uniref:Shock protein HSP 90 n=1 Tax=Seminavis robusta TaxID=568900 RepID=A0A9N8HLI4_9STRA|nr:shock protein HSP 90 [Seminavis robusta]|eukprot:Sro812_g206010.1 shock protein HSP 90 (748) ;mRNA; r:5056-7519